MTLEKKIKKLLELCRQNNFTTLLQLAEAFHQETGGKIHRDTLSRYITQGQLPIHQVVVKDAGFEIFKPKGAKDANGNLYLPLQDHLQQLALDNHYTGQQLKKTFAKQFGLTIVREKKERLSLPEETPTITSTTLNKWFRAGLQEVVVKSVGFDILKPKGAKDADGIPYKSLQEHILELAQQNNYTRQQLHKAFAKRSDLTINYRHNPPAPEGIPVISDVTLGKWCRALLQEVVVKGVGVDILKPKGAKDADGNPYKSPQEHLLELAQQNNYTRQQLHKAFAKRSDSTILYRSKDNPPVSEGTLTITDGTLDQWCRTLGLKEVVVKGVGFDILKPEGAKDADGNLYQSTQDHILELAQQNNYTRQQLYKVFAQKSGSMILYTHKDNPPVPKGTPTITEGTLNRLCNTLGVYPLAQVDQDKQGHITKIHGHAVMKLKQPDWMSVDDVVARCVNQNRFTSPTEAISYFRQIGLCSTPNKFYSDSGIKAILDRLGCEFIDGVIIAPTNTKNKRAIWTHYQNAQFDKLLNISQQAKWRIVQLFNLYPSFSSWDQFNKLFYQHYPNAREDGTPYSPDYLPRLARDTLGVKEVVIKDQKRFGLVPPTNTKYLTKKETLSQILDQEIITDQKQLKKRFEAITGIKVSKATIELFCQTEGVVEHVIPSLLGKQEGRLALKVRGTKCPITNQPYLTKEETLLQILNQETILDQKQLRQRFEALTGVKVSQAAISLFCQKEKIVEHVIPSVLKEDGTKREGSLALKVRGTKCPITNQSYLTKEETLLKILDQEVIVNQKQLEQRFEAITGVKIPQKAVSEFCRANDIKQKIGETTKKRRLQQVKEVPDNLKGNNTTSTQNSSSDSGPQNSINQTPHSESSHALEKDVEKLIKSTYAKMPTDPAKHVDRHNKLVQKLRSIQRQHGLDEKQFKKLYKLVTSPHLNPHPKKKTIKEILTGKTEKEVEKQSKTFEVFAPEKQASTIEWAYPAAYPFEKGVKNGPSLEKTTRPPPARVPVTLIAGLGVPPVFLPGQQRPFSVRARYWVRHNFVHNPVRMQKLAFLSKGAGYVNLGFLSAHVTKDLIHLGNDKTRAGALKSLGYTGAGVAGFYSLSRVAPLTATYLGIGFAGLNMVTIAIPTAIIGYAIADGISEKVAPFAVAYAKSFEAPKHDCAVHPDPFFTPDRFYQHQASKRPVFKVEVSPKSDLYFATRKADWDPNNFMVYIGKESYAGLTDNLVTQVTKDKTLQITSYVVLPYDTTKPEEVIIEGKTYQWAYYNPASAVTSDDYWTLSKEEAQAGIEALNKSQIYTVGCSCRTRPLVYPYGLNEPTKGTTLTIQGDKVQLTDHADKALDTFIREINTYRQQHDRAELKVPYALFHAKSLSMLKLPFPGYPRKALIAQE